MLPSEPHATAGKAANGNASTYSSGENQAGVPTLRALLAAQADYSNCSNCRTALQSLNSTNGAADTYKAAIGHLVEHWNTQIDTDGIK